MHLSDGVLVLCAVSRSITTGLCVPKPAWHGMAWQQPASHPSAQISATEMHLLNAVDKPSPFLIPQFNGALTSSLAFLKHHPLVSGVCHGSGWPLGRAAAVTHFPGRWLSHAHSQRCPDATEPHEPIIYLAVRNPTSASLLDVANQLHY